MTVDEEKDYNNALYDVLKAKDSIQKLKPEYQQQLLKEVVGAEAYISILKTLKNQL